MVSAKISRIFKLAIVLTAFSETSAVAQSQVAPVGFPSPDTMGIMLARAGYVAIPYAQDTYLFMQGKIDTTNGPLILDSGFTGELALAPNLENISGVQLTTSTSVGATAYGTERRKHAEVDRITINSLPVGPLHTVIAPLPTGDRSMGLLGVSMLTNRAAIFDFTTDTLYVLRADTTPPPTIKKAPINTTGTVHAVLQAAGQYHLFLSLMQEAGLMPLLEKTAGGNGPLDSLAWMALATSAVTQFGLDTMPDGVERLQLMRKAMNHRYRSTGQVTAFAPTDAAFARLSPKALQALRTDKAKLAATLRAHLVTNTYLEIGTLALAGGIAQPAGTALGFHRVGWSRFDIDRLNRQDSATVLARATIVQPDLVAVNGVAQGIDRLLAPPSEPSPLTLMLQQQGYTAIPLRRLSNGLYVVEASVGDSTAILVIDTGAPPALSFDVEAAQRTNLNVSVASLTLAPGVVVSVETSLLDLSAINAKMQQIGNERVDGLLGAELLNRYRARFDLGAGMLYLLLPDR